MTYSGEEYGYLIQLFFKLSHKVRESRCEEQWDVVGIVSLKMLARMIAHDMYNSSTLWHVESRTVS